MVPFPAVSGGVLFRLGGNLHVGEDGGVGSKHVPILFVCLTRQDVITEVAPRVGFEVGHCWALVTCV